ncbi:hypothetical protein L0152_07455 [bacterium]|nr:hypothetical protein [bacterium]
MSIGLSNYEGLCNLAVNPGDYIRARAQDGYKFVRWFTDLGWGGASGVVKPDKNCFLYEYDPVKKSLNPNKINKVFVQRLYDAGKAAKQGGFEGIILCLATNPKYYEKTVKQIGFGSYPYQLGFRDTRGFMQVADPENVTGEYPAVLVKAWKGFTKYIEDLVKVCLDAPNPFMFKVLETYNELYTWGSILETHPYIAKVAKKIRPGIQFQFNPPLEELEECVEQGEGAECFKWPLRLMNGLKGFKAQKVSFHGFYKGDEVKKAAALLKKGGIDLKRVTLETDGATPNGTYTRKNHIKHYLWRLEWRKTSANVAATIKAHRELVAAAIQAGVSLNLQDVLKWSLVQPDENLEKFYKECAKELQQ